MYRPVKLNPLRLAAAAWLVLQPFEAAAQPKPPKPSVPVTAPPTAEAAATAAEAAPAVPAEAPPAPSQEPVTPAPAGEPEDETEEGREPEAATPTTIDFAGLKVRISAARTLADDLGKNVWRLRGKKLLTPEQASDYEAQFNAWITALEVTSDGLAQLEKSANARAITGPAIAQQGARLERAVAAAESGLKATGAQLAGREQTTGWDLVGTLLRARCATAICFDNGDKKDWLGIEPLVELPTGKAFSLSTSDLSRYVDNHDLRIDLAAGARVWLFRDVVSVSVYISKPLTDAPVRLEGSSFVYPAASVRRPYPGFALGLLFDSLWLGFDRDELRNGDGQDAAALNPEYPPNEMISSSWTLTIALQPITAFRSAIGTAVQTTKGNSE